ncbi:MAG TPA: PEP-CTERM sorting domain-containing protein [Pyrinomonadaceae bacterium]
MKKLLPLAAALAFLMLPAAAFADTLTFTATTTAANLNNSTDNVNETDYAGGSHQFDLDHHNAYTWKISSVAIPAGQTIVSAQICFKDIANWDTNANKIFVHLLNTANNSGIGTVVDDPNDNVMSDYFAGANSLGPSGLGTDNIKLFDASFNMVGQSGYVAQNYTYNFTAAQLATLAAFINAGNNIAFGFDPDCHYWNNGITFTFTTAVVQTPEPVSMVLLGTGLAGLYIRRRRRQN